MTNAQKLGQFLQMAREVADNESVKQIIDMVGQDEEKQLALTLICVMLFIRFPEMFIGSAYDAADSLRMKRLLRDAPTTGTH